MLCRGAFGRRDHRRGLNALALARQDQSHEIVMQWTQAITLTSAAT